MNLEKLRVLFLPHAARQDVLAPVMQRGRERHAWRVGIMVPSAGPGPNAGLLDDDSGFFALPEISRPAAWESDPAAVARVRSLVRECERFADFPLNRIVLAGERVIGRGFGREFYHWPDRRLTSRVLADNSEPARAVERLFAFVDDMFERFKPDLVLGGHVASPETMVVFLVCSLRGIPCFTNRPSKILSHRGFWSDDRLMLNTAGSALCRDRVDTGRAPSDRAKAYLAEFRNRPSIVAYIQRNWDSTATILRQHCDLALQGFLKLRYLLRGRQESEPKPILSRLWDMYRTAYLVRRQRRRYACLDEAALKAAPYLYLALHKEPELALNVQHPEWHSQKNLIAWLSANLPAGYRLLVREHRFNEGRRPTRFYDDVRRYPGVTLLDPFDSQFKYIRLASLIVTDSGTTGLEGMIFGRRVLLLGENYYSATGLAPVLAAPGNLGAAILAALDHPVPIPPDDRERRLGALVDAEFETTVPDDDIDGQLGALASRMGAVRLARSPAA